MLDWLQRHSHDAASSDSDLYGGVLNGSMTTSMNHTQGAGIQQQIQQEQHGAEEAPVLAAQEPHHGVAAPATGLYALVRPQGADSYAARPPQDATIRTRPMLFKLPRRTLREAATR